MTALGVDADVSMQTLPLAVVRWPKLDQLSTIVSPFAPRAAMAR